MIKIFISCEHASNDIPKPYARLFFKDKKILRTHRAYDIGVYPLAKKFASKFKTRLHAGRWSRLIMDLNRELDSPTLFSEYSIGLSEEEKQALIKNYHQPHFVFAKEMIQRWIAEGYCVVHLGVHSFTPKLDGKIRQTDVGLLFDPDREFEVELVKSWTEIWKAEGSEFRIRKNYPYQGKSSGLVGYLRKRFRDHDYAGIELEVNQKFYERDSLKSQTQNLEALLLRTFQELISIHHSIRS